MKRWVKILGIGAMGAGCIVFGYLAAQGMHGASATAQGVTLTQRINALIDNLLNTGQRLLDLPLFEMLAGIGVLAFFGVIAAGRLGGTRKKVQWGRAAVFAMAVIGSFTAAIVTDRRLAKLQKEANDLRGQLTAAEMAAADAEKAPTIAATAPATVAIALGSAGTQKVADVQSAHGVEAVGLVKGSSTETAAAVAVAGPRKDYLFDLAAAKAALGRTFNDVSLRPIVYDDATDVVQVHIGQPLEQAYLAVVDLKKPGVQIKLGGSLDAKTLTSEFAKQNGCTIAINGEAGLSPLANSGLGEWRGNLVKDGQVLLKEMAGDPRPYLAFDKENHGAFIPTAAKDRTPTLEMYNVIWGRMDAVDSGAVQTADERNRQPRTAMGICADGSRLYLMVVDGRQPGYSMGFTRQDVGDFLKAFGAADGMLCDEGGSSCIYMGRFGGIVNVPSDEQGVERPTYTHFGVVYHPVK